MNKIILLGGSGFIGKWLLQKLDEEKFQVQVMLHDHDIKTKIEKFKGDILSDGILDDKISDEDIVVNLIGQSKTSITNFIDLNILGSLNLLNTCIKKKSVKVILISTINVYGESIGYSSRETDLLKPKTNYGMIKLSTEKIYAYYSKKYGLDVTILRLSHLYGPRKKSGIISNIIYSNINNKSLLLNHNGKQFRDFLYIEDAITGIIRAIKFQKKGFNIFNISSGKKYTAKDLVKMIEKITRVKTNVMLNSEMPDEKCIWANCTKAKKILKFSPQIDLEKGLRLTINQMKINKK